MTPRIDRLHLHHAYKAIARSWKCPVVLACSGGVDSTALLLMAVRARRADSVGPFIVAHIDHRTRADTADEQRVVAGLCCQLGVPFVGLQVSDRETEPGASSEAHLRDQRYRLLARLNSRAMFTAVVTAHTLDDQIETILMRLLSGSGALAAAGMRHTTRLETSDGEVLVVRPLLGTSRTELEAIVAEAGVHPIEDPTNADVHIQRNAIRHRVVPALHEINPGFGASLARSVDLAARDAECVDLMASSVVPRVVTVLDGRVTISRSVLRTIHPAVAGRVIREAVRPLIPEHVRELTFERVEHVRTAAEGRTGAVIEMPGGIDAIVGRDAIEFRLR